jgi:hypothetical protein
MDLRESPKSKYPAGLSIDYISFYVTIIKDRLIYILRRHKMTIELLSATASSLLSLAFSYIPGLNSQYEKLDGVYKRLVMLLLLVVVAAGTLILACTPYGQMFNINVTCDQVGFAEIVRVLLTAVVANQSVFAISPKK